MHQLEVLTWIKYMYFTRIDLRLETGVSVDCAHIIIFC